MCADEHMMLFEHDEWCCKNCPETLTSNQLDRIVERDVSTTNGQTMIIYPALVVLEKGKK